MTNFNHLSVEQLRRRAAYAGINEINGRGLKFSRRDDLLNALQQNSASCSANYSDATSPNLMSCMR